MKQPPSRSFPIENQKEQAETIKQLSPRNFQCGAIEMG